MERRRFVSMSVGLAAAPQRLLAQTLMPWHDEDWVDGRRQRVLPVRIRWPVGEGACGLVFFSHGLGGSRSGGALWGEAWQAAGLAVVHLQHPGSDAEVFRAGLRGLQRGASAEQYIARVADAHFALDEAARLREVDPPWARVALDAIGFSGHSFGARLTQAVAGEWLPAISAAQAQAERDTRPRAFIAFSHGFGAGEGLADAQVNARFGAIERPFLCVTGTRDDAMIVGDATNATRRAVYRGLPSGHKAQLVLEGADHMTFGGQAAVPALGRLLPRAPGAEPLQSRHQAVVARLTTDWWLATLLANEVARRRLADPAGPAAPDLWEQS